MDVRPAGRAAASLLHATGLPELVCSNLQEYETLALKLAVAPVELTAIRHSGEARQMQFHRLKRRGFIALLGGAAAWPVATHAQQPKIVRLGYLDPAKPTDATAVDQRRQFLLGMRYLGYIEGKDFKMEDRYAEGRMDRLPALASELARSFRERSGSRAPSLPWRGSSAPLDHREDHVLNGWASACPA
jgi:hypothetical protein